MTASYLAGCCHVTLFQRRTRTIIFNFQLTKRNRKNSESDQARKIVRDRWRKFYLFLVSPCVHHEQPCIFNDSVMLLFCSGGVRFESRPRHEVSTRSFSVLYWDIPGKLQYSNLTTSRLLPSTYFAIHHSPAVAPIPMTWNTNSIINSTQTQISMSALLGTLIGRTRSCRRLLGPLDHYGTFRSRLCVAGRRPLSLISGWDTSRVWAAGVRSFRRSFTRATGGCKMNTSTVWCGKVRRA